MFLSCNFVCKHDTNPLPSGVKSATPASNLTYKIAFVKGDFILRCLDSKGHVKMEAVLGCPTDMFNIEMKDGTPHVRDGEYVHPCPKYFKSKEGLTSNLFWKDKLNK